MPTSKNAVKPHVGNLLEQREKNEIAIGEVVAAMRDTMESGIHKATVT